MCSVRKGIHGGKYGCVRAGIRGHLTRFFCTQTKYTLAANPPPGYLCHQCAKLSGADPFKKPAVSKKRKPAAEKREVISFEERRFPTLASLCIEVIIWVDCRFSF